MRNTPLRLRRFVSYRIVSTGQCKYDSLQTHLVTENNKSVVSLLHFVTQFCTNKMIVRDCHCEINGIE